MASPTVQATVDPALELAHLVGIEVMSHEATVVPHRHKPNKSSRRLLSGVGAITCLGPSDFGESQLPTPAPTPPTSMPTEQRRRRSLNGVENANAGIASTSNTNNANGELGEGHSATVQGSGDTVQGMSSQAWTACALRAFKREVWGGIPVPMKVFADGMQLVSKHHPQGAVSLTFYPLLPDSRPGADLPVKSCLAYLSEIDMTMNATCLDGTTAPVSVGGRSLPTSSSTTTTTTTTNTATAPTKAPTTKAPTKSPTKAPTNAPTTKAPTKAPTTKAPTKSPTKAPTTKAPTKAPVGSNCDIRKVILSQPCMFQPLKLIT